MGVNVTFGELLNQPLCFIEGEEFCYADAHKCCLSLKGTSINVIKYKCPPPPPPLCININTIKMKSLQISIFYKLSKHFGHIFHKWSCVNLNAYKSNIIKSCDLGKSDQGHQKLYKRHKRPKAQYVSLYYNTYSPSCALVYTLICKLITVVLPYCVIHANRCGFIVP